MIKSNFEGNMPFDSTKNFKYSITYTESTEESSEYGDYSDQGYEVERQEAEIGDILHQAHSNYGIYSPTSLGSWESTSPLADRNHFEKGVDKYFQLHVMDVDGSPISEKEHDFITHLLSEGKYHADDFEEYGFGGLLKDSRWNRGLSYKLDRAKFNKNEKYEVPMGKRSFKDGGELLEEISTHKAIKKGDKIYIYIKGMEIRDAEDKEDAKRHPEWYKDELIDTIPAENEDDLFSIFESLKEQNRINLAEANAEYKDGGGVDEKVYIKFMNKDKGFKRDMKEFDSYEEAIEWGKKNIDNFNTDMVNYKFKEGGIVNFNDFGFNSKEKYWAGNILIKAEISEEKFDDIVDYMDAVDLEPNPFNSKDGGVHFGFRFKGDGKDLMVLLKDFSKYLKSNSIKGEIYEINENDISPMEETEKSRQWLNKKEDSSKKADYSLIGKDVIITNPNDENYNEIGKIISVIEPNKSQLSSYNMIGYVISFPMNNENNSYLREEFEINSNKFKEGGSVFADMSEKEFLKEYFGVNTFTSNPSEYFDIKKMSSSSDSKIDAFIDDLKRNGYSIKKKSYSDFTSVMGVKKKSSFKEGGAVEQVVGTYSDFKNKVVITATKTKNDNSYQVIVKRYPSGENIVEYPRTMDSLVFVKNYIEAIGKYTDGEIGIGTFTEWIKQNGLDYNSLVSYAEKKNVIMPKYVDGGGVEKSYNNPEKSTHVLNIDGYNWYLEKIDGTHFYMSNSADFRGMAHHIGQHKGEPYYEEIRQWLADTKTDKFAGGGGVDSRYFLVKMLNKEAENQVDKLLEKESSEYGWYLVGNSNGKTYKFDNLDIDEFNKMVGTHKGYTKKINAEKLYSQLKSLSEKNKNIIVWKTSSESWKEKYAEKFAGGGSADGVSKAEGIKNEMYKAFESYLSNKTSDAQLVSKLERILGKRKWFRFYEGDTLASTFNTVKRALSERVNREGERENMQLALDERGLKIYDYDGNEMFVDGGGVDEDGEWLSEALESLKEHTDDDSLTIDSSNNDNAYVIGDSGEYTIYRNEDLAEQDAIEKVKEDLQESAEYFNEEWLMGHISAESFFENLFNEWNMGYATDIMTEDDSIYGNRLIAEMVEWGIMDSDEANSRDAEETANERIEDFVQALTEDQINQGNEGLTYYIDNFGKEDAMKVVVENNLIDMDSASKDAVNVDGIGHFLSSYDGNTIYLENNSVAFRTN